jgi:hypothetical protein
MVDVLSTLNLLDKGLNHVLETEDGAHDEYKVWRAKQTSDAVVLLVGRKSERINDTSYHGDDGQVTHPGEDTESEKLPFITAHCVIGKQPGPHGMHRVAVEVVRDISRTSIVNYLNRTFCRRLASEEDGVAHWVHMACESVPKRERLERLQAAGMAEVRLHRKEGMDDGGSVSWDVSHRAKATGGVLWRLWQNDVTPDEWDRVTVSFEGDKSLVSTSFQPSETSLLEAMWTETKVVRFDEAVTRHWRDLDSRVVSAALEWVK